VIGCKFDQSYRVKSKSFTLIDSGSQGIGLKKLEIGFDSGSFLFLSYTIVNSEFNSDYFNNNYSKFDIKYCDKKGQIVETEKSMILYGKKGVNYKVENALYPKKNINQIEYSYNNLVFILKFQKVENREFSKIKYEIINSKSRDGLEIKELYAKNSKFKRLKAKVTLENIDIGRDKNKFGINSEIFFMVHYYDKNGNKIIIDEVDSVNDEFSKIVPPTSVGLGFLPKSIERISSFEVFYPFNCKKIVFEGCGIKFEVNCR